MWHQGMHTERIKGIKNIKATVEKKQVSKVNEVNAATTLFLNIDMWLLDKYSL